MKKIVLVITFLIIGALGFTDTDVDSHFYTIKDNKVYFNNEEILRDDDVIFKDKNRKYTFEKLHNLAELIRATPGDLEFTFDNYDSYPVPFVKEDKLYYMEGRIEDDTIRFFISEVKDDVVDVKTVEFLSKTLMKDKDRVYYGMEEIVNADLKTIETVTSHISKDKDRVYLYD